MKEVFHDLRNLIAYSHAAYVDISQSWLSNECKNEINLKKTLVRDCDIGSYIYKNVESYRQYLAIRTVNFYSDLPQYEFLKIETRIKNMNSVAQKIENYKTGAHEYGKTQIIRCLNDLFGIRAVLNQTISYEEICEFLLLHFPEIHFRVINASNRAGYKAFHIYFRYYRNVAFPWELQVWNVRDEKQNKELHKIYKEEYTSWEKAVKEDRQVCPDILL